MRVIKADAPRFVHAHWTYEFALGAIKSGVSTVTTIHDLPWHVLTYFRDPHRFIRLLMAYEVAWRGETFTAVSTDAAAHFQRYFRPKANITVIPNGLPDLVFQMGEGQDPRNDRTITFASILQGWSRLKNAKAALEAFSIVRREIPHARLKMFGLDYEQGGPAQQWAIKHDLDADVTFLGKLPYTELMTCVKKEIDVLVHPSLSESFSMTALEAMALRKPVIAGRETTGVSELLGFGKSGVLVDVTDPHAIAAEMLRLAQDESYRDRIAQCAYDRASSQYRLGAVMDQYESLYSRILQARPVVMGTLLSTT
jgi:glycosyltransferase involved in cell wall biosynthesis